MEIAEAVHAYPPRLTGPAMTQSFYVVMPVLDTGIHA